MVSRRQMPLRFIPLATLLLSLAGGGTAFSQTIYDVVPVDLGDGYEIAGGTITIEGSSVTAWNIPITGDVPYTFSNTNPGAAFRSGDEGFIFSSSEISFSANNTRINHASFEAFDSSSFGCQACKQSLIWVSEGSSSSSPRDTELTYVYNELAGPGPLELRRVTIVGGESVVAVLPSAGGDCNNDGVLNSSDLSCVNDPTDRDTVISALNTVLGDLDLDGSVAFSDFLILSHNFGDSAATYVQGNIDLENGVGFSDFLILSQNFGLSTSYYGSTGAIISMCGCCRVGLPNHSSFTKNATRFSIWSLRLSSA